MTNTAEDVLLANLTDVNQLEVLAREGMSMECVPTIGLRPVVEWCVEYYFASGRLLAPSADMILANWSDALEKADASLGDGTETDTMISAVEYLRNHWIDKQWQEYIKKAARAVSTAPHVDKAAVVREQSEVLFNLCQEITSRRSHVTVELGIADSWQRYLGRESSGHSTHGLLFDVGFADIDNHVLGIHPGELAMLAAPPKTGKSYFLDFAALKAWRRGRIAVLFTLENSVEMTYDRIACLHLGIDARRWQLGQVTEDEKARVRLFLDTPVPERWGQLHVIQPDIGERSMSAMVRQAEILGCQDLFIDQLTFVEPPDPRAARHEQIRDMLHELKALISGPAQIACLLAHQVNREGQKLAEKAGRLEMWHLAEGSEAERTCDFVFALYQSHEARQVRQALFQMLAARRVDLMDWLIQWRVEIGAMSVLGPAPAVAA